MIDDFVAALDALAAATYKHGTRVDGLALPTEYRYALPEGTQLTLIHSEDDTYYLTAWHDHSEGWPVTLAEGIPSHRIVNNRGV